MPYGRLPVLKTPDQLIPDTHHIQAYLEDLDIGFNAGLIPAERAQSHALIRMVEENLVSLKHVIESTDRRDPE